AAPPRPAAEPRPMQGGSPLSRGPGGLTTAGAFTPRGGPPMRPRPSGAVVCAMLAGALGHAPTAEAGPPNIVVIFSDDHAFQAISAYNDPRKLVETPNIDRIARQGVRFDRCVVPNSICGPSRATVLTGKYSHVNGFYNNTNSRFDASQTTFPKLLQAAGYRTAVFGKWHLVSDPTGFDEW